MSEWLSPDGVTGPWEPGSLRPETVYFPTAAGEVLGKQLIVGVKKGETIQPEVLAKGTGGNIYSEGKQR